MSSTRKHKTLALEEKMDILEKLDGGETCANWQKSMALGVLLCTIWKKEKGGGTHENGRIRTRKS